MRLSRSLLLEAKAKVRPFMDVSTASLDPGILLRFCRMTKEKFKMGSSLLFNLNRYEGKGEVGEDSGS